jgi:hypothetical protein
VKKVILIVVIAAAAIAGLVFAYREMSKERAAEAEGEKAVTAPSFVKRAADGSLVLTLDAETQKRLDLKIASAAATRLDREAEAYGRVLDPAPLAAVAAEMATARVGLESSTKELERLKRLAQDQNASTRAVESAEAAVVRDRISADAAHLKLVSAWGKDLAAQPDLPAFVTSLAALDAALVRVELPVGEVLKEGPLGARLATADADADPIDAEFVGLATATDPTSQGQAFLFRVENNRARLTPGMAVVGFLKLRGEPSSGVLVPRSAVVRWAAKAWVFVQTGNDTFVRREISLARPTATGWFVATGVSAADRLVVEGAQTLLSEEQKSQIQLVE